MPDVQRDISFYINLHKSYYLFYSFDFIGCDFIGLFGPNFLTTISGIYFSPLICLNYKETQHSII